MLQMFSKIKGRILLAGGGYDVMENEPSFETKNFEFSSQF